MPQLLSAPQQPSHRINPPQHTSIIQNPKLKYECRSQQYHPSYEIEGLSGIPRGSTQRVLWIKVISVEGVDTSTCPAHNSPLSLGFLFDQATIIVVLSTQDSVVAPGGFQKLHQQPHPQQQIHQTHRAS